MTGKSDMAGRPDRDTPSHESVNPGAAGKPGAGSDSGDRQSPAGQSPAGESQMGLIVKNAGIDGVGTAFNILFMFFSGVIITRTIGADLFGKYSLSKSIFDVMGVFAVFGLNTGVIRLTSKYNTRRDPGSVKGTLLSGMAITAVLSAAIVLAIVVLAPFLARRVFDNVEGIDLVLRIHFLGLPFFALMMIATGYTQGLKTLKYSALVELIVRPLIRLAVILVLFLAGLKLFAVVFGSIISFLLAAALAFYFGMKISSFDFRKTSTKLVTRELFFYSVPLVLARFMNVTISRSNTILVGFFKDSTSTGLFGAAIMLSPFISLSLISFGKIFAPVISELWEKGELSELEKTFKTVSKWVLSLGYPIFLIIMLFAPSLLKVFGDDFVNAATTLRLLAIGQIVNAAVGPAGFILSMTGRQKLNMVNSIGLAALNIALNIILIPSYGIAGAALATTIALGLLNVARVIEVKILYGFTPFRRDIYKPLLAGTIALLLFYLLKTHLGWEDVIRTLALCVAFLIVYIVLLLLFGLREEKEVLLEILRRRKRAER
jgi:O-antigen/teichoic acid export membrane protein